MKCAVLNLGVGRLPSLIPLDVLMVTDCLFFLNGAGKRGSPTSKITFSECFNPVNRHIINISFCFFFQTFLRPPFAELPENWTDTRETILEGMTFSLRHLGMTLVDQPKGEEQSAAAVKRIVATVRTGVEGMVGGRWEARKIRKKCMNPCRVGFFSFFFFL